MRMTKKNYALHSVRIEDEVWEKVKASGMSVNQMLRKALEMPFTQTRQVVAPDVPDLRSTPITYPDDRHARGIRPKGDAKR